MPVTLKYIVKTIQELNQGLDDLVTLSITKNMVNYSYLRIIISRIQFVPACERFHLFLAIQFPKWPPAEKFKFSKRLPRRLQKGCLGVGNKLA
jgi:hypothetical protein